VSRNHLTMDFVELTLQSLQRRARKSRVLPHGVVANFSPFQLEPSKLLARSGWLLRALPADLADTHVVSPSPPSLLRTVCIGPFGLASQASGAGQASLLRPEAGAWTTGATLGLGQGLQLLGSRPPNKLLQGGGLPQLDAFETLH
jgi:hypothetical protein